ncbi:unnamed protein product, partial [marine sediment metagenome]
LAVKISALCDEYGIDQVEMAQVIGFTMECFDKGILTKEDTDGLRVEWGDAAASIKLTEMTAYREGFGDVFAEGVKRASEKIGSGKRRRLLRVRKGLMYDSKAVDEYKFKISLKLERSCLLNFV